MNFPAVWQEFFDFLRKPRLPGQQVPFGHQAVVQVGMLLLLDWAIIVMFEGAAFAVESGGIEIPRPIEVDWTPTQTFLILVVLAPPLEELIFRAWLTRQRRVFPYAFWLTSALFGLSHISNFEDPISFAALFMVIPMFTGGTILRYVRVRYGMWSNIAQHATHNAVVVALFYAWPDLLA